MSKFTNPLNNVKVASPCPANWDGMFGDERKRYCGECKLNVYNLSAMTRAEAEALITQGEGRLCVRFYQRADGTVITQDCPAGWAAVKNRAKVAATAFASLIVAILTGTIFVTMFSSNRGGGATVGKLVPYSTPVPPSNRMTMGAVSVNSNRSTEPPERPVMGNVAVPQKKRTMTEVQGEVEAPVVRRTM